MSAVAQTTLSFRCATAADADQLVPLVYSSGPAAFDYVFTIPERTTAPAFLHRALAKPGGEFGYANHVIVERGGAIVATGAAWSGRENLHFAVTAAREIVRHYGVGSGLGVIARGLRVESVIQPAARDCWYLAHLGVRADLRSLGVGAALVDHLLDAGRQRGFRQASLDVAQTNPRARALYERLGFVVDQERVSHLAVPHAVVPSHFRMTRVL